MLKLLLLSLLSLPASVVSAHDGVSVTLSLVAPDALRVEYQLPASCQGLNFINHGIRDDAAAVMRANWTPSDACGALDKRGVRRTDATCKSVQLTVPAATRDLDRIYPWAFPIGGGMYSHTSAFAVDDSCGPVHWQFKAPGGVVVLDGVPIANNTAYIGQANYKPVIFLATPLAGAARSYTDPRVSSATAGFVTDAVNRSFALYERHFAGLGVAQGFVAITASPDASAWKGDVAGHTTIRLMVPASLPAAMEKVVRGFAAHEVGHMMQPLDWHDTWNADQTMLSEGGADMLQWMAQAELGWSDGDALQLRLETALNNCVILAAGRSWNAIKERGWGRAPYDCGLAFHALGLAANAGQAPAWQVMRNYYAAARRGGATDFANALECAGAANCKARWLERIGGAEPLAAVLSAYARTGGFLKVADGVGRGAYEPLMRKLVERLMANDCGGQISLYQDPDMVRVGPVDRCKTLRQGMNMLAAEGEPLFAGAGAVKAVYGACNARGAARFTLQDGRQLELGCDGATLGAIPEFFEVDVALLRQRLGLAVGTGANAPVR